MKSGSPSKKEALAPDEPTWRSVTMNTAKEPKLQNIGTFSNQSRLKPFVKRRLKIDETKPNVCPKLTTWNVSKEVLRTPIWMLLEKTHVVIENTDVATIADRIVTVNKEMSVMAQYDSMKGRAMVQTSDDIDIIINLFKSEKKTKTSGIVVEVQRRSGCTVAFRKYSRPILLASQGCFDYAELSEPPMQYPALPDLRSDEEQENSNARESLNVAKSLLMSKSFDEQHLGIQNLSYLTDITKTKPTAAVLSSRAVLCDPNEENVNAIQRILFQILQNWELPKKDLQLDSLELSSKTAHNAFMGKKALSVLANALNVILTIGKQEDFHKIYEKLNESHIINVLWEILENSHKCPHDALLSVKCLNLLLKAYPASQRSLIDRKTIINDASTYGMASHSALFRECEGLLANM